MLSLEFEKNGDIITLDENDLFDFRFERGCFSGDTFELGGVNSNLVYCVIDNNLERFPRGSFANSRLTLYVDGVFCGRFNTELPKRRNGVIEITAYDDMLKLDCEYPDTYLFPQTFLSVYAQCVYESGLASNISFDNFVLNALFNNGVISHEYTEYIYANSCRNLVSGMAEWNGGFAYINDDGKLQVDVFSKDVKKTLYSGDLLAFDYSDETVTFSKIRTSQKNKTYEMGDDSGYTLVIRNQYIGYGLEDTNFETYFNFICDHYKGFSLTPMTFTLTEPDLSLKIGDRISVVDEAENVTVTGNISKIVIRGNCVMEVTCGGFGNIGSTSNYKPTSLSQTAQAKTEAKVSGGGGVGKASDWDKTSEYFNDYENNIAGNKDDTKGTALYATAMGQRTTASGSASVAMGSSSVASGAQSVAMGYGSRATGSFSFAMGYQCTASYHSSLAAGWFAQALGASSAAFGSNTKATGQKSVAFGGDSAASGTASVAGGDYGSKASGDSSIAIGNYAEATANYAVAIGQNAKANYISSAAVGAGTQTVENFQFIVGAGNDPASSKNCAFVVGGGKFGAKRNAFSVDWDGNAWCANNLKCRSVECKSITFEGENAANTTARIVFIDHAPTKADVNGAKRVIVQYDPSEPVKDPDTGGYILGSGTALFKVVGVFVEK